MQGLIMGAYTGSDDGGTTWYNYHTDRGLPISSIGGVAVSSNYVFICTGNGDYGYGSYGLSALYEPLSSRLNNYNPIHTQGVYYNVPSTTTWQDMNGSSVLMIDGSTKGDLLEVFENGGTMRNILVHPSDDNILFLATSQGIFRTTNRGVTWQQVLVGPSTGVGTWDLDTEWRGLEFNPLDPSIIYASGREVYYSRDGGTNWTSRNITPVAGNFIKRINIALSAADTSKLYAYSVSDQETETGLYLQENGSWTFLQYIESTSACYNAIAVAPSDATVVHIGAVTLLGGTYPNLGANAAQGFSDHDDVHAIEYPPHADSTFLIGNHGGVERNNRYNNTNTRLYTGLGVATIWSFDDWEGDDSVIVMALQDNGIFHTNDNAESWIGSSKREDGYGVRMDDHTGTLYTKYTHYNGLYRRANARLNVVNPEVRTLNGNINILIPLDNGTFGNSAFIPNTFPLINHPKNEKAYLGFSELYYRDKETYDYDGTDLLPTIDSVLKAKRLYPDSTGNSNPVGTSIGTTGRSCVDMGGTVVGILPWVHQPYLLAVVIVEIPFVEWCP